MKNNKLSAFGPRLVSLVVLLNGIFIVVFSLVDQMIVRRRIVLNHFSLYIALATGLTLIYLSALLARRKRTALIATAVAYAFYLGASIEGLTDILHTHLHILILAIFRSILLPLVILLLLFFNRHKYVVRSDSQSFRSAIIISLIILAVTFVYGTLGFYTLGRSGFHRSFSVPSAMHHTVDQLNLTTNNPVHTYNRRAQLFDSSLSFISAFAVLYVLVAFVQPLKGRFGGQGVNRKRFLDLLNSQGDAISEDFFKLWPHDKQYFFDSSGKSGLSFHVHRGVALVLGGPTGKKSRYRQLLSEFQYVCFGNDWQPAIIHADDSLKKVYEDFGYTCQKIGEEAVLGLDKFLSETVNNKYFRNISSRFTKQDYTFELLKPPHSKAVMDRIKEVSDQWLSRGSHMERGYALGYFNHGYISNCQLAIARDDAGTIQAFLNLVPANFDKKEATYDLLRSSNQALGNVNDFLLINLAQSLKKDGYVRLNLGLCPLVGIEGEESKGLVGSVLRFAYANGDRFYSFSGLYRFKDKYGPNWQPRYAVYKGGVRGFSKTMNALMWSMRISPKSLFH